MNGPDPDAVRLPKMTPQADIPRGLNSMYTVWLTG